MKRTRETKKELPEQVIRYELFTRLPVKSLVRFKAVCKSWLSLISDPVFAKQHYNACAMQNPNRYDCLVANKDIIGLVILSRHEENRLLPFGYADCYNKLIGCIHGLICLRHDKKLWLWNPAIHQCKGFMYPQMDGRSTDSWDNFGFGFDPISNDYKVVVFNDSYRFDEKWPAFVYSFNSDTWNPLVVPDYPFANNSEWITYCSTTIVKDCPYWTSFSRSDEEWGALHAFKFETQSNEFKLLPEFLCRNRKYAVLVNMMDRPTFLESEQDCKNIDVDVYSLDDKEGSGVWSKMYSVGPIGSYSSRPYNMSQGFKYGGETVFHQDGLVFYYDRKTNTISPIRGSKSYFVRSSYRYTPSLFFLKGMELDTALLSTRVNKTY